MQSSPLSDWPRQSAPVKPVKAHCNGQSERGDDCMEGFSTIADVCVVLKLSCVSTRIFQRVGMYSVIEYFKSVKRDSRPAWSHVLAEFTVLVRCRVDSEGVRWRWVGTAYERCFRLDLCVFGSWRCDDTVSREK